MSREEARIVKTPSPMALSAATILAVLLGAAPPAPAAEADRGAARIESAVDVLETIAAIPEKGIPPRLLQDAHGVAVIPNMFKAGLVIGGKYGSGILTIRRPEGGWSLPVFITVAGGSIGYQIGAESADVVLVFKTRKSVEGLMDGTFTLGADAGVAAGPLGRRAEASTDAQLKAEIYSYARSRGLFAGVSLEGAAIRIDGGANETFYGREGVSARDIIRGKVPRTPAAIRKFEDALARLAKAS